MAARMSVRSLLATVLATLLLASVVPGADANRNRQKIMHQTAVHAAAGNLAKQTNTLQQQTMMLQQDAVNLNALNATLSELVAEKAENNAEAEAEIEVLEEEVEENFATRLADAMTGDAEDMTPLIWVFAFGIILVVVSAVTGMVIMSSILKKSVGRAEAVNDLNFLKLKQRAMGLSVKNIKGGGRV